MVPALSDRTGDHKNNCADGNVIDHTAASRTNTGPELPAAETDNRTDNDEGPHRKRWGPSTSCPVRHWRRIRDSNS